MIDIHSHILPGLDDGARTLEESVAMLRIAAAAGTTDIVASPHANLEYVFDPEVVERLIAEVQAAAGDAVKIHYGCDFHLTMENIQDALAFPEKYSINHRAYLLVEFSDFMIPKTATDVFAQMLSAGLRPVVTHPERNPLLQRRRDTLEKWVNMGCLMQVTASSFNGRFGRQARAAARELMQCGLVQVVATDAHDTRHRPPAMEDAYHWIAGEYSEETARILFVENPRAILAGVPIAYGPLAVRRKKWYERLTRRR
jgi:protein-tyrosine phosphatase